MIRLIELNFTHSQLFHDFDGALYLQSLERHKGRLRLQEVMSIKAGPGGRTV